MRIKENIVSWGHGSLSPSYICIHETANPGATAWNHVCYWSGDDTYAVHYVMDWDGIAYHCVPDNRLCWQVGNGNAYVLGIELCHATSAAQFQAVWDNAVEWAAVMLKRYGWGTARLISHAQASQWWGGSDHTDPIGYFAAYGKSWEQFVAAVAKRMKEGKPVNKQEPGQPVNNAGMYYRAHVSNLGWLSSVRDGQVAGTTGNGYAMEALKVKPPEGMELTVKAHVSNVGWRTWTGIDGSENSGDGSSPHDPIIGSVGKSQGIEAIEIDVVKNPKKLRVSYRVHVGGHGWGPWIPAGYAAGTTGIGAAIEAIQIKAE